MVERYKEDLAVRATRTRELQASYSVTGHVEIAPVYEIWGDEVCVNADVGRWTGASIAGLVVGAIGVFVFAVALRYWLNRRRAFRDGAPV